MASRGVPCPGQQQGSVFKPVLLLSPLPDKPDGKGLACDACCKETMSCGLSENITEHLQTLIALCRPLLEARTASSSEADRPAHPFPVGGRG